MFRWLQPSQRSIRAQVRLHCQIRPSFFQKHAYQNKQILQSNFTLAIISSDGSSMGSAQSTEIELLNTFSLLELRRRRACNKVSTITREKTDAFVHNSTFPTILQKFADWKYLHRGNVHRQMQVYKIQFYCGSTSFAFCITRATCFTIKNGGELVENLRPLNKWPSTASMWSEWENSVVAVFSGGVAIVLNFCNLEFWSWQQCVIFSFCFICRLLRRTEDV